MHSIHVKHDNRLSYLLLSHTKVKEVDYLFTQHMFLEQLLCARHYSRLVESGKNKVGSGPDLCGQYYLVVWLL